MGKDKNRGYKEDKHYNAAQYELTGHLCSFKGDIRLKLVTV